MKLTDLNNSKGAKMADAEDKLPAEHIARAIGRITMGAETLSMARAGGMERGDVLAVAQVAGILAAKKTCEIVPLCRPIQLTGADVTFYFEESESAIDIEAEVRCFGIAGVEMEALTAVSAAALTIYDMCKGQDAEMEIGGIVLVEKTGDNDGSHGRGDVHKGSYHRQRQERARPKDRRKRPTGGKPFGRKGR